MCSAHGAGPQDVGEPFLANVLLSNHPVTFSEGRNTDRPDASAVYLQDFQRFLLHEQQVRGLSGAASGTQRSPGHLLSQHSCGLPEVGWGPIKFPVSYATFSDRAVPRGLCQSRTGA